jgi:chromosome condensin MukBEF MukE localization factor
MRAEAQRELADGADNKLHRLLLRLPYETMYICSAYPRAIISELHLLVRQLLCFMSVSLPRVGVVLLRDGGALPAARATPAAH